eukprot:366497-Chlamydomonas_euryale.AAC.9
MKQLTSLCTRALSASLCELSASSWVTWWGSLQRLVAQCQVRSAAPHLQRAPAHVVARAVAQRRHIHVVHGRAAAENPAVRADGYNGRHLAEEPREELCHAQHAVPVAVVAKQVLAEKLLVPVLPQTHLACACTHART